MPDVPLRKRLAGSDSYGHQWGEDGAVVQVSYDEAMALLAIPDGGFTVADQPEDQQPAEQAEPSAEPGPEPVMDEVAPEPESPATDASAKKTAASRRKTS